MLPAVSPDADRWFFRPAALPPTPLRLFGFPHAGAGPVTFHGWAQLLSPELEFIAVRTPGRELRARERPYTRLGPLVEALAEALSQSGLCDRPFAFFGHSVGALTAFELARELRRRRAPLPSALFLSALGSPDTPVRRPALHALPEPLFLRQLADRYEPLPGALLDDADMLRRVLPLLRADLALAETYLFRPEPPLPCPIRVYAGLADPVLAGASVDGWRQQTCASFSARWFPGAHFFLREQRESLLADIRQHLPSSGGAGGAGDDVEVFAACEQRSNVP